MNSAGFGSVASVLADHVGEMEAMIGLNITAPTRLTCAIAPVFTQNSTS